MSYRNGTLASLRTRLNTALPLAGLLFAGVTAGSPSAQASASVDVIVKVPSFTPAGEGIYLTGSAAETCGWVPACVPMRRIHPFTYKASVTFPSGTKRLEYKITRGNWQTEASQPWGGSLPNFIAHLSEGRRELVHNIANWSDQRPLGVTGELRVYRGVRSPQLGNHRTVRVWLPPQYALEPQRRFPVIYMHDGQNVFDPSASTGGVDWGVDEAMSAISHQSKPGPAIVVAVDSSSDRMNEYDYTTRGDEYARFLIETLKPMIDRELRTRAGRESTFTMGSSMGALISLALVWHHSDVFSAAGAVSLPAHAKGDLGFRIIEGAPLPKHPVRLLVDHGDFGGDEEYLEPGRAFHRRLLELGFPAGSLRYDVIPYADHHETDWARRSPKLLRWMLGG